MDVQRIADALAQADAAGNAADAYDLAQALRAALAEQQRSSLKTKNPAEYDPSSPLYQAKYGATSGMDTGQRMLAGAGKAYMDIGRGVEQLTGNLSRGEVDALKAQDAPLMQSTAAKVGNIGGNAVIAAPTMFIPGVNGYTGAALTGAVLGGLQPVGTNDSRGLNMAMGAGSGMAGKFAGDRILDWAARPPALPQPGAAAGDAVAGANAGANLNIRPGQAAADATLSGTAEVGGRGGGYTFGNVGSDASAGLSIPERRAMQAGQAIGMRTTPGQATGSRALQQMEAKLESQPMTSGPFNAIKANNAGVLARTWARAIGENSDRLDSATLDHAATRLGRVFDDAGDDAAREIDPAQFLQAYSGIQQEARGVTRGFDSHPLVNDLVQFAQDGSATGHQLQSLTSKLGKAAYKEMSTPMGDRDLGMALYQMKDYVDDLLQQGMSASRRETFQQARQQYRNLMLLTSRTTVLNPTTGTVNARSLASVLQKQDRAGYLLGRNTEPHYQATRFAQAFQPIVGDSGTATRMPLQGVTDFFARIPYNIAARAYTSSPAIQAAMRAQAATQAASRAVSPVISPVSNLLHSSLGTVPFYAPYYLPGAGGLLGAELASQ